MARFHQQRPHHGLPCLLIDPMRCFPPNCVLRFNPDNSPAACALEPRHRPAQQHEASDVTDPRQDASSTAPQRQALRRSFYFEIELRCRRRISSYMRSNSCRRTRPRPTPAFQLLAPLRRD